MQIAATRFSHNLWSKAKSILISIRRGRPNKLNPSTSTTPKLQTEDLLLPLDDRNPDIMNEKGAWLKLMENTGHDENASTPPLVEIATVLSYYVPLSLEENVGWKVGN